MDMGSLLAIIAVFLFFAIIILAVVYWRMSRQEKKPKEVKKEDNNKSVDSKSSQPTYYNKQSVFDFMEFDKIEDNMIIQKKGRRFIMVIECQGINYDLMSEVEQNSVEQGFMRFLNTLREPVQLYIQTRTINLDSSIETYKDRIREIETKLKGSENQYRQMIQAGSYTQKEINSQKMEITRLNNLLEYGRDIVFNTERMSSNRNVLKNQYYVVVSYYYATTEDEWLSEEEIKGTAFSELYVKCQSLIRALSASDVVGKILNSNELVDLLYNAYNRDEAEAYKIDRALRTGYDELYTTAPDVYEKRIKSLNAEIEQKAFAKAQAIVDEVESEAQKQANKIEKSYENLIDEMAESILKQNEEYLGKNITEKAVKKVRQEATERKEKRGNN